MLNIRKVNAGEIDRVMEIYDIARNFMRENGNVSQWINGYPHKSIVSEDIAAGNLYAVCNGDLVCGVFYFNICDDETYGYIENGSWLNNEEYGVIHRIASDGTTKGVLRSAAEFAFEHIDNVRIDTHEDNAVMQRLLGKLGFTKCGIIYLNDGSPRIAFQKKK